MKKTYRISVYNRTTQMRELMWERYSSRKKAQEFADAMNRVDPDNMIKAYVITETK